MTEIDTSKEMIQLSVEALRKIANDQQIHAPESWDDSYFILRAADRLDALLFERDALRKAVDSYSYIGRDGKMVLAKDLEDERDALLSQLQTAHKIIDMASRHADAIRGAVESNQVADKDVRGTAKMIRDYCRDALKSTSAKGEG